MHPVLVMILATVDETRLGTAQVMTFAIPLGFFMAVVVASLFWLRSGHERARRQVLVFRQLAREQEIERSQILDAHEPPAGRGERTPR